jgi:hypothetical protein
MKRTTRATQDSQFASQQTSLIENNDDEGSLVCYESLGKRVKTSYKCNSCGVGLCNAKKDRNCFVLYHSQDHN